MKFKIGDKVKLVPGQIWAMGRKIGTIVGFQRDNFDNHITYVLVKYEGSTKDTSQIGFPFHLDEIELAIQPGEQLEFAFMSD